MRGRCRVLIEHAAASLRKVKKNRPEGRFAWLRLRSHDRDQVVSGSARKRFRGGRYGYVCMVIHARILGNGKFFAYQLLINVFTCQDLLAKAAARKLPRSVQ